MRTIWLRHLGSVASDLAGGGIPVIRSANSAPAAELRKGRNANDMAEALWAGNRHASVVSVHSLES
jgi:hypothetical protein